MENPFEIYWNLKLAAVAEALGKNGYDVSITESASEAAGLVKNEIISALKPKTLSWGGSLSFAATGLYEELKEDGSFEIIDTWDKDSSFEEKLERRREAMICDLYFTGTNALTETGWLVNLDMIGNRVGAMAFGPKNVVVVCGRNKIVPGLEEAMQRIKDYAAPVNSMRLDKKTPCRKTGVCHDCDSPERICNVWTIHEKCFPAGRIKVVLVNEDLGF
ncbi:lactate utilization protein [Salidesulfovibrio brasiliensis]|uniref:lactate utilization protein n=1 Tax=Salidesulfovibrio brasiliensis TaxID=221711 RepID=UPI0006D1568B|nr:lactate utilization protein [Salidesulfovibrio brasiliensis]